MNSTNFVQMLLSGCHRNRVSVQENETFLRRLSHYWTCLAPFPPLWSFSHLTPPRLCPFLLFPTRLLSVSCLESQSAGQPKVHKLVSGGAVEREATCSGGSAAFTPIWGLFSLCRTRLFFQARPLTMTTCIHHILVSLRW